MQIGLPKTLVWTMVLAGLVLTGAACAEVASQDLIQANVSRSNVVTSPYRLAPGDVLRFSIDEEPDFTQEGIVVRPDGYATIPPVGLVAVAGKKVGELVQDLEERLTPYVNAPQVYITVQQFHTPKIYLAGAVMKPGAYEPQPASVTKGTQQVEKQTQNRLQNSDMSVLNVLVNSGGVQYTADLNHVQIKAANGSVRTVNLLALIKNADTLQDFQVEEGDTITVPSLATCPFDDADFRLLSAAGVYPREFPVRILGRVEKPGLYYVASDSPLLNSVIALASGYQPGAIKGSVQIRRPLADNTFSTLTINPQQMDVVLRPNDVIEVKTNAWYSIGKGVESASRMATPFVWLAR